MLRISDEHWDLTRKHFPEEHYPDDSPGCKPIPARKLLEAVLWILNTGIDQILVVIGDKYEKLRYRIGMKLREAKLKFLAHIDPTIR